MEFSRVDDQANLLKKRVKSVAREVARKVARKIVREIFDGQTIDTPTGVFDSTLFVVKIAQKEAKKYAKKETDFQANRGCCDSDESSSSEDEVCDIDVKDVDLMMASLVAKQVATEVTKEKMKNW